jgi:ligand-binding sensor domain-containing protein
MQAIIDAIWRRPGAAITCVAIICCLLVVAIMPESRSRREDRIQNDLDSGKVVEIAEGEDGAKLWAVEREGHVIYFSKGSVAVTEPTDQGQK